MWDLYVRKETSFCYKFSYKTEEEARAEANKLFANGTCRQCYITNFKTKEHAYLLKGER
ncbi:conserved hypothetical protein [Listeria monocytogenes]|nr:hypothetical protein [Listeria monocytogenes]MCB2462747.1 hypothetical protein [Listeria monocytogenes]MCP7574682.1 hypothetical protein [Listeria monocytogenes]CUK74908.1 conserved hypothetical protein [Listeria monocytogenes]CWV49876.1 Uncharacterised protein [Listeria monocytogenes]